MDIKEKGYFLKASTTRKIKNTPSIKARGNHNGQVTHHQDQSMCPVSLRMMKVNPSKLKKEIEPERTTICLFVVFMRISGQQESIIGFSHN